MNEGSRSARLGLAACLALGALLRALALGACLPYLAYTDEGHVLHPVMEMLRTGSWDPAWYGYPSLPLFLIRLAGSPTAPGSIPESRGFYDLVGPAGLVVAGRRVAFAAGLAIVGLTFALAERLGAGRGRIAGLLAAVAPALVYRSSVVNVDIVATAFILATLLLADRLRAAPVLSRRFALLAGGAAACAMTSKYTWAPVVLVPLLSAFLHASPLRQRVQVGALVVAGWLAAAAVTMPALVLKTSAVLAAVRAQSDSYRTLESLPLVLGATKWWEAGWLLPAFASAGVVFMLSRREERRPTLDWALVIVPVLAVSVWFPFQPFRNVLPLVPLGCVAVSALVDGVRTGRAGWGRVPRPAVAFALAAVLASTLAGASGLLQWRQMKRVDSRVAAVNWLAAHARPADRALFLDELAFLPSELSRTGCAVDIASGPAFREAAHARVWKFVVSGGAEPFGIGADARKVAEFGETPLPVSRGLWRGNGQRLEVWEAP